jgi:ATP phosphoribosyltransferase regulatory subunit
MYRYNEFGGGRQREFSQAGVELMGSSGPEADAEIIATAIAAALACGIDDLQVSIGQVAFFQALLDAWQIPVEQAALLPRLIDSKELVALEELADQLDLPERARQVLTKMTSGFGTYDVLDELEQLVDLPAARAALQNLRDVLAILADFGVMKYITIDLGMLQSLNYYTGIIFKGFTYGLGFPLFSGGRYDRLVEVFGRKLAATGFSMGLGLAMTALRRQGKPPAALPQPVLLGYAPGRRASAFHTAEELRRQGRQVVCDTQGLDRQGLLASRASGPVAWLNQSEQLEWLRQGGE